MAEIATRAKLRLTMVRMGKSSFQYHGPGVSCFRGEPPNGSRLSCGAETARSTQQHPDYHHSTSPDATSLVLRPGLRLSKPMRTKERPHQEIGRASCRERV